MPLGNTSEDASGADRRVKRVGDSVTRPGAIPLGRIGGARLFLSGIVLVAAAVVVAISAAMTHQQGNADLPMVVMIGSGFWAGAWLVQLAAQWVASQWCGLRPTEFTINLIGVESGPGGSTAGQSLFVSLSSIAALVVSGIFFWWADGGFQTPMLAPSKPAFWPPPSIDLASPHTVWRVGAWLFWVQAVCQMFPLPRTTGRQILAAMTVISAPDLDESLQINIFRKCLVAFALGTLVIAIVMISHDAGAAIPRWPFVFLLAALLWASSRARDVGDTIVGFRSNCELDPPRAFGGDEGEATVEMKRFERTNHDVDPLLGIAHQPPRLIQASSDRRRAERETQQKRREAIDASQLDDILNRLHENGADALSSDDRAILDRVSHALRNRRSANEDDASLGG